MIDKVFGIKVRMSGLSINQYRLIIGLLPANNAIALSVHLYERVSDFCQNLT